MNPPLRAFHGDPAIKEKYIARVRMHREADNLIHGIGWENGKGCAVGCTLESYDHNRYPIEIGVPIELAYVEDRIFEELKNGEGQAWPEQFLEAIPVGADLSMVWCRFVRRLLADAELGTLRLCDVDGRAATLAIIALLDRHNSGDPPSKDEWIASAAAYAAAAYAAAAYAAAAAAYADADADAYASASAASAAASAARANHYTWMAKILLEEISKPQNQ